jgi:hypothetical protein
MVSPSALVVGRVVVPGRRVVVVDGRTLVLD